MFIKSQESIFFILNNIIIIITVNFWCAQQCVKLRFMWVKASRNFIIVTERVRRKYCRGPKCVFNRFRLNDRVGRNRLMGSGTMIFFFHLSRPSRIRHSSIIYRVCHVIQMFFFFLYIIINTIYLEIKLNCQYFYTHTLYMTPVPIYQFLFYLSFCTTLTPCVRLWLEFVITVHWLPFISYIYI